MNIGVATNTTSRLLLMITLAAAWTNQWYCDTVFFSEHSFESATQPTPSLRAGILLSPYKTSNLTGPWMEPGNPSTHELHMIQW